MEHGNERYKTSKRNFIIALILLLSTNALMGIIIMHISKNALKEQIIGRMLDVSNTAAAQIDGDDFESLTASDVGSEKYNRVYDTLSTYQENIKLEYIYAIKKTDSGSFIFVLDPDKENPAEYGEEILKTDALLNASRGRADVDKEAHADEWGRFYSAYSPIKDSTGKIVGIVGVDFNAEWYDSTIDTNKIVSVILVLVAMALGVVLSFSIMSQNRRRFEAMMKRIDKLYYESLKLDSVITETSIKKLQYLPDDSSKTLKALAQGEEEHIIAKSEYDEVASSVELVYDKLNKYLAYIENEVDTDDETGVSSKISYKRKSSLMNDNIKLGRAHFSVAFIDINDLHRIYTCFGYELGDAILYECGQDLVKIFGKDSVFHIMGPEYVVVAEGRNRADMEAGFKEFDKKVMNYNFTHELEKGIVVAKGYATFDKELHNSYREVFIDAKAKSDKNRNELFKMDRGETVVTKNPNTIKKSEREKTKEKKK
ncbi:MAG: diguanylate cyclase [Lachnospiraceae bacterium]|nr:diguanylate cyclase [Lachnospiraceae bacterium]